MPTVPSTSGTWYLKEHLLLATPGTTAGDQPVNFERIYLQAIGSVRRDASRVQELSQRYRERYRRRLDQWLQLRARMERNGWAVPAGSSQVAGNPDATGLRTEHEALGRELAGIQSQLKRLDTAARQLELVWGYLGSDDPQPSELELTHPEESVEAGRLRIVQAQEAERQRLAEEIHDGPAQVLTNAIFQLEYVDRVIGENPRTARTELGFLRTMLRDGLDEMRSFITALRPPVVDMGLAAAISTHASEFQARHAITVHTDVERIDTMVARPAKASVLRIIQESLQNVRKHSAATEVHIAVEGEHLTISDNGRGFDVMRLATGGSRNFGLQFMRERAELMGSQLQIESRQGEGTRILLRIPPTAR
ncbi:MAG: hypothetical protein DLM71_06750 [Chloroflexi bacterium]|nr:MAG: hypothetical protein DLM71_06750 [Chloroflexota bacterium]